MNLNKKSLLAVCGAALSITLSSCNGVKPTMDLLKDSDDAGVYKDALGEFEKLLNEAEDPKVTDADERYVRMAKAEAALLDSGVMMPTTTRGGNYAITRVAPHTVAYTYSGNDDDKLRNLVVTAGDNKDSLINKEHRAELMAQWQKAVNGEGEYTAASVKSYLEGKGYTISKKHQTSWSTAPETLDILNTSAQADTETLCNVVEGLVEFDNIGHLHATGPEDWTISDDGKTYTFSVPANNPWVDNQGKVVSSYGNVTAEDYVTGFQHMLDAKAGLEWLVSGVIKGVSKYLKEEVGFEEVGFKAVNGKVVIELEQPEGFFPTRLAYTMFSPVNKAFFESKGGVLGIKAFAEKKAKEDYTYGKVNKPETALYCGAFYVDTHTASGTAGDIVLKKNSHFFKASETTLDEVKWVYDAGENLDQTFNSCINGNYSGIGLTGANLQKAKDQGIFDSKAYITDTESTTFFGGVNLHRQTYGLSGKAVRSKKTVAQAEFWQKAVLNKNLRKAIVHSFDKATYNAVSVGEDIKNESLRNMYTKPDFVKLSKDVTLDGQTFNKNTDYGDVVQYYLEQLGTKVEVADGKDGWYKPEEAKKYLEKAKEELAKAGVKWDKGASIEVVYLSTAANNTAQAKAYQQKFNEVFKDADIKVTLIEAKTSEDFYKVGYRAANGAALGADLFYGSGWGPDYADPSTYLDTFKPNGDGYMTKVIGLW